LDAGKTCQSAQPGPIFTLVIPRRVAVDVYAIDA
jgi:hypothetical protein